MRSTWRRDCFSPSYELQRDPDQLSDPGPPASDMSLALNASNRSAPPPDSGHNLPALVIGILLIVFIIGGNVMVCLSVYAEKALKTTTNYFIVSLAVADLLLAILVLPLYVYAEFQGGMWTLNMVICDGLMTMDVMLCTASIFNLCAISIDRFIAVSIPLNYNRKHIDQRQTVLLSATWILALAVASPVLFGINNVPHRDPSECKLEDDSYVVYSSVCSFFIPCPIMLLLYCGMFRGLRRWEEARKAKLRNSMEMCRKLQQVAAVDRGLAGCRQEEQHPQPVCPFQSAYRHTSIQAVAFSTTMYETPSTARRAKINGRERKAMKVLPVVVGIFLFCWTPFFVVHTTRALCTSCEISPFLISTVTWLGYANSALNPIIYTVFNTEFRNFFHRFLHSCC